MGHKKGSCKTCSLGLNGSGKANGPNNPEMQARLSLDPLGLPTLRSGPNPAHHWPTTCPSPIETTMQWPTDREASPVWQSSKKAQMFQLPRPL